MVNILLAAAAACNHQVVSVGVPRFVPRFVHSFGTGTYRNFPLRNIREDKLCP